MTEVNDRSRHVWVAPLVGRDGVALRKAQKIRDALRINEIIRVDLSTHRSSLQPLTAPGWDR